MAERSGFFNAQETSAGVYDRTYNAEDFSNVFRQFLGNGIMVNEEEANSNTTIDKTTCDGLKPSVPSSGGTSQVEIATGWAFLNGFWYHNDSVLLLDVSPTLTNFKLVLAMDLAERQVTFSFLDWNGLESDLGVTKTDGTSEILIATGTREISGIVTITDRREDFITTSVKVIQDIINGFREEMSLMIERTIDVVYPVGSIFITTANKNPQQIMPFTQWESFGAGRVLVGVDTSQTEFNAVEKSGGSKTHTLTVDEMPLHNHTIDIFTEIGGTTSGGASYIDGNRYGSRITSMAGGGRPHNNLQPYITVYMWKRIR